ncbi:ABC transporter permease [Pseudomonas vlassakiae]|uniref:ABC transporter permease n=2 Tax=Pseudomonas vlassakiae TaxID=485888 RepID=UPI0036F3CD0C
MARRGHKVVGRILLLRGCTGHPRLECIDKRLDSDSQGVSPNRFFCAISYTIRRLRQVRMAVLLFFGGCMRLGECFRLAWDLARRDLQAKYKRSLLGIFWMFLTPLCLLCVYTVVFGGIFKISWQQPGTDVSIGFVLPFFIGLSIYLLLSDVINSSTVLYSSKRTYVAKSPFPLWVLWLANLMRAYTHGLVYAVIVLVLCVWFSVIALQNLAWASILLVLSLVIISAVSLALSIIGPFIGDISEAMRLLMRVLFYAAPISYPVSLAPESYRFLLWLNPLTVIVEPLREALVFGHEPSSTVLAALLASAVVLWTLSVWLFNRIKGVVADVV